MDLGAATIFGYEALKALLMFATHESILSLAKTFELGLVVFLILVRKPTRALNASPFSFALVLLHVFAPYYFVSGDPIVAPVLAELMMGGGMLLVVVSLLSLGKSFGILPAYRSLQVQGPYQWVRHPIYLGHLIIYLAVVLANFTLNNVLAFMIVAMVAHLRIVLEERVLGETDSNYLTYKQQVRTRLVPTIY